MGDVSTDVVRLHHRADSAESISLNCSLKLRSASAASLTLAGSRASKGVVSAVIVLDGRDVVVVVMAPAQLGPLALQLSSKNPNQQSACAR